MLITDSSWNFLYLFLHILYVLHSLFSPHSLLFSFLTCCLSYPQQSLRILCITNLFCWMSLVCYSLYFTDFVGEAVFGGDPRVSIASVKVSLHLLTKDFHWTWISCFPVECNSKKILMHLIVFMYSKKKIFILTKICCMWAPHVFSKCSF